MLLPIVLLLIAYPALAGMTRRNNANKQTNNNKGHVFQTQRGAVHHNTDIEGGGSYSKSSKRRGGGGHHGGGRRGAGNATATTSSSSSGAATSGATSSSSSRSSSSGGGSVTIEGDRWEAPAYAPDVLVGRCQSGASVGTGGYSGGISLTQDFCKQVLLEDKYRARASNTLTPDEWLEWTTRADAVLLAMHGDAMPSWTERWISNPITRNVLIPLRCIGTLGIFC
jgi:hypothetical protein